MTYRERRERRAERRREWAEGRTEKAEAAREKSHRALDGIPFGQPILVGHHSEKRHRADLGRADGGMTKAAEHSRMATHHERAAETIEAQLDVSIYDDDPDAIERLRARIEARETRRGRIRRYNRNRRKGSRDLSPLDEAEQKELADIARVAAYQLGPKGEAPRWWLSNLGAAINRDRKRLARLEGAAAGRGDHG